MWVGHLCPVSLQGSAAEVDLFDWNVRPYLWLDLSGVFQWEWMLS